MWEYIDPKRIRILREKLIDYYGSAMPFFIMAADEVFRVENMSDEEILEEAKRLGID